MIEAAAAILLGIAGAPGVVALQQWTVRRTIRRLEEQADRIASEMEEA